MQRTRPDADDLYALGAFVWTWHEMQVPDGESLADWLRRRHEDRFVQARATTFVVIAALDLGITGRDLRLAGEDATAEGIDPPHSHGRDGEHARASSQEIDAGNTTLIAAAITKARLGAVTRHVAAAPEPCPRRKYTPRAAPG